MSLAVDHIRRAVDALAAGRLPDDADRLHLVAAVERAEAGLSWDQATGRCGTLAVRQRDHALMRAAGLLTDAGIGPWHVAGRLSAALERVQQGKAASMHPPLREALSEAITAGNGTTPTSRRQLYRLLTGCC